MLMTQMTFEEEGKKWMKITVEFCVQSWHLLPNLLKRRHMFWSGHWIREL